MEERHAGVWHVFHTLVVVDVTEQQVAAFLPPDRSFRRALRSAETIGQMPDRLGHRDDLLQLRRQLFNSSGQSGATVTRHRNASPCKKKPPDRVSTTNAVGVAP